MGNKENEREGVIFLHSKIPQTTGRKGSKILRGIHSLKRFIFYFTTEATNSLRLSKLAVPSIKYRTENALLECQYELNNRSINSKLNGGYDNANSRHHSRRNNHLYYDNDEEMEETLYSVKWYKDGEEFYRYVPRANPPQSSYTFDGIKVDVSADADAK